jgi:hypothetical protein
VESSEKLSLKLIRDFKTASTFDTKEGAHCQRCPHLAGACPVLE